MRACALTPEGARRASRAKGCAAARMGCVLGSGLNASVSAGFVTMMGGEYAGDWNCPECGAMVFASKNACYKCKTPKPAGSGDGGGYGGGGGDDEALRLQPRVERGLS